MSSPAPADHEALGSRDVSVVRFEEHLEAGTVVVESGRVRVRRYVTTEMQTITVPVRREHVVLEELEPRGGGAGETGRPTISEPGTILELVLHEERVEVTTTVVPVERVRVVREVDVVDEVLTAPVHAEQVEVVDS